MSDYEDEIEKVKKMLETLRSMTSDLTEEQKQAAKMIAAYLQLYLGDKDHEGKQVFLTEDYKKRN